MSQRRASRGAIELTAGVSPAIVAKNSQMRPFHGRYIRDRSGREALPLPPTAYLSPEKLGQAEHGAFVAQAKQTNQHSE